MDLQSTRRTSKPAFCGNAYPKFRTHPAFCGGLFGGNLLAGSNTWFGCFGFCQLEPTTKIMMISHRLEYIPLMF